MDRTERRIPPLVLPALLVALATALALQVVPAIASTNTVHWVDAAAEHTDEGTGCGTGAGYKTIEDAERAAADGDTINVCAGTYKEAVEIEADNLTLQRAPGTALGDVIIDGSDESGPGIEIEDSDGGVTVAGFVIREFKHGIFLNSGDGHQIIDNTIHHNEENGIYVDSGDGHEITGNTIHDNEENGIFLDDGNEHVITGNTIHHNVDDGIRINWGNKHEITDNTIHDNDRDGIRISRGNEHEIGNPITGNTIQNNADVGIRVSNETGENTIENNQVTGNGTGMRVSGNSNTIRGNDINDNVDVETGLFIEGDLNTVEDNEICDNSDVDLRLASGTSGNTVQANYFETDDVEGTNTVAGNHGCPRPTPSPSSSSSSSSSSSEPDPGASVDTDEGEIIVSVDDDDATVRHLTHTPIDPDNPPSPAPPEDLSLPFGLIAFDIADVESGACVDVTIQLPGPAQEYWKLQNGEWFQLDATFDGATVTFELCDGGIGDASGEANGYIQDPGAPALRVSFTG